MTQQEKRLALEVLSALAWADGEVTDDEQARLVEFIAYAGDLEQEEVRTCLNSVRTLSDQTLKGLEQIPLPLLAQLLSFSYDMANAERPVIDTELALLQQVCSARLEGSSWSRVEEWLSTQRRANDLYDELFSELVSE